MQTDEQLRDKILGKLDALFDEYHLNPLQRLAAGKFVKDCIGDKSNAKVDRIREWLMKKINNLRCLPPTSGQRGCPNVIPGLRAKPWWDSTDFPWIKVFEDNFELIKQEVSSLKTEGHLGFQPYRAPNWMMDNKADDGVGAEGTDRGKWNIFYLFLHDVRYGENCARLPQTVKLVEEHLPRHYHHALVSAMLPKTHIVKHWGPTNKKLRFHLPLLGVEGSVLKVNGEERILQPGKGYVFDDSFEHEAWHDGPHTRVILIADFWHPDLSDEEVRFLNVLQKAQLKTERLISAQHKDEDNFFNVIDQAKGLIKDNDWWSLDQKESFKVIDD